MSKARFLWLALWVASADCGKPSTPAVADGGLTDGGADDPDPVFTDADRAALAALSPPALPPPPADVSNRFADDPAAAAFGQRLFFTPLFSGMLLDGDNDGSVHTLGRKGDVNKVACAGCHIATAGFVDNRTLGAQVSLAVGWGRRRAPSLLDVGQARLLMWDGRRDALYNQVFGPIESPVEMNSSRLYAAEQVFQLFRSQYESIFGPMPPLGDPTRFPALSAALTGCQPLTVDPQPVCDGTRHGMPGDGAEFDHLTPSDQDAVTRVVVNLGKAIAAYERLLSCGSGRFDAWIHSGGTLSRSEQRGAQLFVAKAACVRCHSGPFLSDQKFHNVGLTPQTVAVVFLDANDRGGATGLPAAIADPLNTHGAFSDGDDGRLPRTVGADMEGAFRTPNLRCLDRRPTFMHTGQMQSVSEVVDFFSRGGDPVGYPGVNELSPLGLSSREQADLVAFLATLSGPGPSPLLTTAP